MLGAFYHSWKSKAAVSYRRFIHAERLPIPDRIFGTTSLFLLVFGVFLFGLDRYLQFDPPSWFALSLSASALVAINLIRRRMILAAKLLVHGHVVLVLSIINMMFSLDSLILFFVLPVLTSLVVVFKPGERVHAFVLGLILVALSTWFVMEDPRFMPIDMTDAQMRIIRVTNVLGALGFALFQIRYTVRVNDGFQQQLLEQGREADVYNAILESHVQERNQLIQMMSHDLRSPFGNLVVSLDDVVLPGLDEQERLATIRRIRTDALSTLEMLDGILVWVRSRQGSLKLDIRPAPLRPLVEQVVKWLSDDAARKGVPIEIELEGDDMVLMDRGAMASVFRNLLSNGLKFTPSGGRVMLRASRRDGCVRCTIADTGRGMTQEELAKIRARISFSNRGTGHEKGHGVGLLIVQDLLDRHASTLEVHQVEGSGTVFMFSLPLA